VVIGEARIVVHDQEHGLLPAFARPERFEDVFLAALTCEREQRDNYRGGSRYYICAATCVI